MGLGGLADLLIGQCSQQTIVRAGQNGQESASDSTGFEEKPAPATPQTTAAMESLRAIGSLQPRVCAHWQIVYEHVTQQLTEDLMDVLRVLNTTCNFRQQNSLCNFGYLMLMQTVRFARNNDLLY